MTALRNFAVGFALLFAAQAPAADVSYYGITKLQEFQQTVGTSPVIISNGYSFNAFVLASTNGVLTNATVQRQSTPAVNTLVPQAGGDVLWQFTDRFNSDNSSFQY